MDFPALVGLGTASFIATNMDDLLILMVFFSNPRFSAFQIVLGQYVGMGSLLAVSLVGSLVALVVPADLIGLVGIFPIAIGIKELFELRSKDNNEEERAKRKISQSRWVAMLPFLTVAVVTFSGGEEIGIYTSVFATNRDVFEIITVVSIVLIFTAFWCGIAVYLVKRSSLAVRFRAISAKVLPFVLIGLGIYILAEAFLIPYLLLPS